MDARNISSEKSSYDETKVPSHGCLYNKVANSFGEMVPEIFGREVNFAVIGIENNEKLIKN